MNIYKNILIKEILKMPDNIDIDEMLKNIQKISLEETNLNNFNNENELKKIKGILKGYKLKVDREDEDRL